ncbi:MAG: adenylate/guanylate cyclase domain-containing protein [Spirochaetales bacterium]
MKKPLKWIDALSSLLLVGWYFLPLTASPAANGLAPLTGPALQALFAANPATTGFATILLASWLIPLFVAFRVAALFVPESLGFVANPLGWAASVLRFVTSGLLVVAVLVPFSLWGDNPQWYLALPVTTWVLLGVGMVLNVFALAGFVDSLNHGNKVYSEYQQFMRTGRGKVASGAKVSPVQAVLDGALKIRAKLLLAFIAIIAVILLILSSNLLSNYQKTILKAVGDGAQSGVEQATSAFKSAVGGETAIVIDEFFIGLNKVNAKAAFPFRSFVFYTDLQSQYLLDKKEGLPPALNAAYANSKGSFAALTPTQVAAYLDPVNAAGLYDAATNTYSYAGAITINQSEKLADGSKVKHERLLGLAVVTFDEDVILAPYVQTRTIVFILTFLFLYFAIALVFIVGNFIVNPLLFLRMNVRNASETLESMIRGQARVAASSLQFADTVNTRDEIKTLSGEIGNMVTIIRGIIPYISASTLKQAEKGTTISERRNLTFLFTDIRGFTTMSEGMTPEEVVQVLNRYLDLETEIILQNHGDVDKFVGDEMMAFFDGPEKELNACRAAMQIRKAMFDEKVLREKQGLPSVEIGIGINTGDVVFGSMGARERMDFTSIGDTVNLAARLEGANKAYSSKSMIAESVYLQVQDKFVCRELDFIAVKGKTEPVRIYEILQEKETANAKLALIAKTFGEALTAYRAQDWKTAGPIFQKLVDEYRDEPAKVFVGRIRHFEKNPPAHDWDGVFRMDVK